MKIKTITLFMLALTFCAEYHARSAKGTTVLDAILRGSVAWEAIFDGGEHFQQAFHLGYSSTADYPVDYWSDGFSSFITRNIFQFDLSSLANASWVTEATLQLEHVGTTHTLTYSVGAVDPTSNPLSLDPHGLFWSIESNYGNSSVAGANAGDVLNVVLNGFAISDINAAHRASDLIALGGSITAGGNVGMFQGTTGLTTQLALTTAPNSQPVADLASLSILLGDGVTFDGGGSSDADSIFGDTIVSYEWDLDHDGTFDFNSQSATLALTAAELNTFGIDASGSYEIALRVEDSWGASGTIVQNLIVTQIPEPTSLLLGTIASLGLLTPRRGRKKVNLS